MPYSGRNNIYDATIKRMVNEAIQTQEQEFAANRNSASDEQLLAYLCFCASVLNHTPWPREIVGGSLIEERFGTWENALKKAKLSVPTTSDKISSFVRYQEEVERQKILYRQKKSCEKAKKPAALESTKRKAIRVIPLARMGRKSCQIARWMAFQNLVPPLTPWGRYCKRK